jgi:hypothetical protein
MTVFISSLIGGMQPFRQGARSRVNTLRHQPMAVDFCAQAQSPQIACLAGIRQSGWWPSANPRAMKIPAEKRALPDLNPLPKIPLELIRLHALTARGAVREHLFRFLVSPLFPQRENGIHAWRYPAGTNVKPYWQLVRVLAIGKEMPMRPIR